MEIDPRWRGPLIFGATTVVSAGVGFAVAYFWSERQKEQIIQHEIDIFKAQYTEIAETRIKAQASARANEEAKAILEREGYSQPTVATEDGDEVTADDIKEAIESHIFDRDEIYDMPEWDQEAEERTRTREVPYILNKSEFYEGEPGYTQMHVTYFEEDDVLVDDENEPVPDVDAAVGQDNLQKFGYGSDDNRVLYVRNDILQIDFEITRDENSFSKTVLGFIQHDDTPRVRRFRMDRD